MSPSYSRGEIGKRVACLRNRRRDAAAAPPTLPPPPRLPARNQQPGARENRISGPSPIGRRTPRCPISRGGV